jgi:hypothetical protein
VNPEHGGRIELKLSEVGKGAVEYSIVLSTQGINWRGSACVDAHGAVELSSPEPAPPAWLADFARALLRTLYRTHHEDGAWPRRLTRWRAEPSER